LRRVDGDADSFGERRLGKPDPATDASGVRGGIALASASSSAICAAISSSVVASTLD
jgi:hypothetical protein